LPGSPQNFIWKALPKKLCFGAQIHKRWAKFCIKAAEHPKGAE